LFNLAIGAAVGAGLAMVRNAFVAALRWLSGPPDWHTWVGHGLQGAAFGFLFGLAGQPVAGIVFTMGAFGHREVSQYIGAPGHIEDHIFDFLTPVMAASLAASLGALLR